VRPHKGVEDAIAALDLAGIEDARLVLVGGREAGSDLAGELARRHPGRVVRLGRFGVDEMPAVIAAAHAVIIPQRDTDAARAQLPMKLTDAMAMARPVVATRVGDIPEVLGEAGYLAAPSSPQDLARALREVFAEPEEARRRGEALRRRCVSHYSHDTIAPLVAAVVEGALRKRSGRRRAARPARARSRG